VGPRPLDMFLFAQRNQIFPPAEGYRNQIPRIACLTHANVGAQDSVLSPSKDEKIGSEVRVELPKLKLRVGNQPICEDSGRNFQLYPQQQHGACRFLATQQRTPLLRTAILSRPLHDFGVSIISCPLCPPAGCIQSQGHPFSLAHLRTSRCPP